jgi:glycosyltransferase involved in cell wall biosynthesis
MVLGPGKKNLYLKKMNIAIQNLHKLPNIQNYKIHNYVLEMIRQGLIRYLYFDDKNFYNEYHQIIPLILQQLQNKYSFTDLGLDKTEIILSSKTLSSHCDVLLNFNTTLEAEFTPAIKKFSGLKIFHLMDYFWIEPGSEKYKRLKDSGVDYLMSYGSPDRYCQYFQKYFPDYLGKIIPVPFGYSSRFISKNTFQKRLNKCVAVGSVNPMRPEDSLPKNYLETANFYAKEKWMHKFRHQLVVNRDKLSEVMDSMLPIYPQYKDFNYDIVEKFNQYQMFVSDETIFYFPTAKTFEGLAAGSVLVCSDHPCFSEYGFQDGINCIKHRQFETGDFKEKINYYQNHQKELNIIHTNGYQFVRKNYSHPAIASNLYQIIENIYHGKIENTYWPKEKKLITNNPPNRFKISSSIIFKNKLFYILTQALVGSFFLIIPIVLFIKNLIYRLIITIIHDNRSN